MKNIFSIILIFISTAILAAGGTWGAVPPDGRKILTDAVERSRKMSFTADTRAVVYQFAWKSEKESEEDVKYSRYVSDDGQVLLRLDVANWLPGEEYYLHNKYGWFGVISGSAAQITDIPLLRHFELNHAGIDEKILSSAEYRIKEIWHNQRRCFELTLVNDSVTASNGQNAKSFRKSDSNNVEPAVRRVFVIDRNNGFIYIRKDFNQKGEEILSVDLGRVDFTPPAKKLFKLPRHVEYQMNSVRQFQDYMTDDVMFQDDSVWPQIRDFLVSLWQRMMWSLRSFFSRLLDYGRYIAAAAGICCIGSIIVICMTYGRRTENKN